MSVSITRAPSNRLLVACDHCDWSFTTPFGPLAVRAANLHAAHAHPRHVA